MSENTVLALIGALLGTIELLTTVIGGWIAFELRALRKGLEAKVDKSDCTVDMCRHGDEIRNLWIDTRANSERIARLEAHQ